MEITGSVTTVALMALFAGFLAEAVKRILRTTTGKKSEAYEQFIPIPLAVVSIAVGVGLAYLQAPGFEGMSLVQGGASGFVAAALAAFGYDFIMGIIKPVHRESAPLIRRD